jgi:predicted PurR-regulated permease PerM
VSETPRRSPEIQPSQVSFKTVFTVSFGVLLVAGFVYAVSQALVAVALTGAALLIAVSLEHLVRALMRRGFSRSASIALVILLAVAVLVGFGFTLIPPAIAQGKQLIQATPGFLHNVRNSAFFQRLDLRFHLAEQLDHAIKQLPNLVEGAASPVLAAVGGVLTGLAAAITIAVLTVFMLIFGGRLLEAALTEAREERRAVYAEVLHKIYQSIGGYLGGLMLICLINATLTTIFLAIDGVSFFLPLGIVAGLSSLVPYAGPFVVGTGISLIAFATQGALHGVAAATYFISYGQVEGNILGPLIFRRTVHVNPLVVTLSVLFFGELAGIMGAIVAVPVVATLQIILREVLRIRREQLRLASGVTVE